jgi:hypothetical protein
MPATYGKDVFIDYKASRRSATPLDYIMDRGKLKMWWEPVHDEPADPGAPSLGRTNTGYAAGPDNLWPHERLGRVVHNERAFAYECCNLSGWSECPGECGESATTPDVSGDLGEEGRRRNSPGVLTPARMTETVALNGETWHMVDAEAQFRQDSFSSCQASRLPSLGSIAEDEEPETPESPVTPKHSVMPDFRMVNNIFDAAGHQSSEMPDLPISPTHVKKVPSYTALLPLQDVHMPKQRARKHRDSLASIGEVLTDTTSRVSVPIEKETSTPATQAMSTADGSSANMELSISPALSATTEGFPDFDDDWNVPTSIHELRAISASPLSQATPEVHDDTVVFTSIHEILLHGRNSSKQARRVEDCAAETESWSTCEPLALPMRSPSRLNSSHRPKANPRSHAAPPPTMKLGILTAEETIDPDTPASIPTGGDEVEHGELGSAKSSEMSCVDVNSGKRRTSSISERQPRVAKVATHFVRIPVSGYPTSAPRRATKPIVNVDELGAYVQPLSSLDLDGCMTLQEASVPMKYRVSSIKVSFPNFREKDIG